MLEHGIELYQFPSLTEQAFLVTIRRRNNDSDEYVAKLTIDWLGTGCGADLLQRQHAPQSQTMSYISADGHSQRRESQSCPSETLRSF